MSIVFPKHEKNNLNSPCGFEKHCKVAALIINELGIDPHTKHHIRAAIREATHKVTEKKGDRKSTAHFISTGAIESLENNEYTNLVLEHVVPVSYINELVLDFAKKNQGKINNCDVERIVLEWTCLALITKKEDGILTKKSLPDPKDKFSRYTSVKLTPHNGEYKELKAVIKINKNNK